MLQIFYSHFIYDLTRILKNVSSQVNLNSFKLTKNQIEFVKTLINNLKQSTNKDEAKAKTIDVSNIIAKIILSFSPIQSKLMMYIHFFKVL